jgi:antirestriction protein ArdC
LVAELGSAFVLAALGIDADVPNTAAYFRGWAKTFTDDKRALVWAAGRAAKAADMLLGLTEEQDEEIETENEQAA